MQAARVGEKPEVQDNDPAAGVDLRPVARLVPVQRPIGQLVAVAQPGARVPERLAARRVAQLPEQLNVGRPAVRRVRAGAFLPQCERIRPRVARRFACACADVPVQSPAPCVAVPSRASAHARLRSRDTCHRAGSPTNTAMPHLPASHSGREASAQSFFTPAQLHFFRGRVDDSTSCGSSV